MCISVSQGVRVSAPPDMAVFSCPEWFLKDLNLDNLVVPWSLVKLWANHSCRSTLYHVWVVDLDAQCYSFPNKQLEPRA